MGDKKMVSVSERRHSVPIKVQRVPPEERPKRLDHSGGMWKRTERETKSNRYLLPNAHVTQEASDFTHRHGSAK